MFIITPLMHSESGSDTRLAIITFNLVDKLMEADQNVEWNMQTNLKYAQDQDVIVQRFGRYPQRNELLGRKSTEKELQFLETAKT